MQEPSQRTQLGLSPQLESTTSLDAQLLARVRQDLIGHLHIKTADEFIRVMQILVRNLNKNNPYSSKDNRREYFGHYLSVQSFVLAWSRKLTCEHCSSENLQRSLHFHHVDPKTKSLDVGGTQHAFPRRLRESLKCLYLCEDCHYQEHIKLGNFNDYFNFISRRGRNTLQSLLGGTEGS
jgi:hypothetical protein